MLRRLSLVMGYLAALLAVVIFWWLRGRGLLASTPYWVLLAFITVACAGDVLGRVYEHRCPESVAAVRFRLAMTAATTALVLYATGWGSLLTIGFALGATQVLVQTNRAKWQWAYGCNLVAIALGELAIQLRIAPTLVDLELAHAVALTGAICLAGVLWVLGETLAAANRSHQQVLEREARLLEAATHDPLTRLPNRTLFNDRLQQALRRRSRVGGYVAVMIVDLDGFKNVNDSLGHPAGDELLVAVSERFRRCMRETDTIARLGGDEFALLCDDLGDPTETGPLAQRVLDSLAKPLALGDRTIGTSASIGVALAEGADVDDLSLLSHADLAMYRAKREGKGCYRIFEDDMHHAAVERLNLEQDLRAAVRDNHLFVMYQPIVDIRTGRAISFEALVRWHHPVVGLVPPETFVPLAEEAGLATELGRTVLLTACLQARDWRIDAAANAPSVAVNVSRPQLIDGRFPDTVAEAVQRAGLEPSALVLEVTESVLAHDSGRVVAALEAIHTTGVRIAIDDFGTGYSSLASLSELPIDVLKIDKGFVDKLADCPEGRGLVEAVLQLARTLGLGTVAEGVEREEQLHALAKLGCTAVQGFLVSPPLSGDDTFDFRPLLPRGRAREESAIGSL